ncbi:uncharacterized protein LOC115254619 isoform X1 [Aedes albopictus]|uniref:Secreted protein n=1 Tax=Aedes albopictus TaxID=7160 RepID=A0ABM1Y8P2_AEDAL
MAVLGLWILLSLTIKCSIGYVINQPPAEFYSYQEQPYDYQWQPLPYGTLDYPPTYYNTYHYYYPSTYNYPEYYKPYPETPMPIYYGSYYYNYPSAYEVPVTQKPYSPKSDPKQCPSYDEGQKLLQVYRLIREIELCRSPPKKYKKMTSLDKLVQKLTKQPLEHLLVEVVCHVKGYEKVADLDHCYPEHHHLVNDNAQLLVAIQKALNALDLDDYYHDHHDRDRHYHHGCCDHHKELCVELRYLRNQANELTEAQIKKEMVKGIKATVKQAFDTDILEDLDEALESRLLDLETLDVDVPLIESLPEPPVTPQARNQEFDQELLEQLSELIALEQYLQQNVAFEPHLEKSQDESVYLPSTAYPSMSTTRRPPTTTTEEPKASWIGSRLGSLLGETHLLPGYKTINVDEPAVLLGQPVTIEKVNVEKSNQGSTAPESEAEKPSSGLAATLSAPLWLTKNTQQEKVENKESGPSFLNKLEEMLLKTPEHRQETEDATEGLEEEAREVPFEVPLNSHNNANGPTRFDLLKVHGPTPALAFIDKETPVLPGHTSSAESRNQQSARQVVKQEVIKVLSLLEEAFPELEGHVSDPDVDQLVGGLRDVEAGIKWTEMLSAVQKMIARKKLSSGEQILDVLEHWKEDEEGRLNTGYFDRTYGGVTTTSAQAVP